MIERKNGSAGDNGVFERLLEAISDKHGQVDVNLQGLAITLPGTPIGVEVRGLVTFTIHMRDLTEGEKKASAAKNVAMMSMAEPVN
jgi:hypothetical protein